MLFVLITLIGLVCGIIFTRKCDMFLIIIISVLIVGVGAIFSVGFPEYEEEPIVEEVPLVCIGERDGINIYLNKYEDNKYIYSVLEENENFGIGEENILIIEESDVKVFEDENICTAVFQKNIYKSKLSLFSLPIHEAIEECTFLIPKGSLIE